MLNRAARYFPILRELEQHIARGGSVLEVGSGSLGMGEFSSYPFMGCDVKFEFRPKKSMRPVICSADQLPFRNSVFDAVVVSDVLEHIAPDRRKNTITEILRVARSLVLFGYPCGPDAFQLDRRLRGDYQSGGLLPPIWLEEHILHPFPDRDLFVDLPPGWKVVRIIPNETLRFHYWMMRKEMFKPWGYLFRLGLLTVPGILRWFLDLANHEPSYRKIFVLTRA